MSGKDPAHWLYRLTADEWLRAAEGELQRAHQALARKQQRQGVAGARRAAGMAWNAVLVIAYDEAYGRSYMDHLKALRTDAAVPGSVRIAAATLDDAALSPTLIQLGPGDTRHADAAHTILDHARERVRPTASA